GPGGCRRHHRPGRAIMSAAPSSAPDLVEVTVTDRDGIIWAERMLRPGTSHRVPADVASRWISEGRARGHRPIARYLALGTVFTRRWHRAARRDPGVGRAGGPRRPGDGDVDRVEARRGTPEAAATGPRGSTALGGRTGGLGRGTDGRVRPLCGPRRSGRDAR